ncbi:hypothetical protein [Aureibacter tunicatorum]|uniref:Uncharacterized protein n=1 Tax=Aureibacter tunicatorum TaxID=866807 RepID=A0AAE3XN36_9BACT|nr:hypothetical protein [Aureibacter tunicatorum]MDR6238084.1 hypothetical protein [Aureibacter tunicatorum]BDD03117.1 hypothetical protein AUTU_06000 [Aureibacter tunicatorum]
MKLPSLFKTPKHSRFHFEPRYYDPIKEEIQERTERIKREMKLTSDEKYKAGQRISGSFSRIERNEKQSKTEKGRLMIILAVLAGFFGYIWYGDWVLYILGGLVAMYVLLRIKGKI